MRTIFTLTETSYSLNSRKLIERIKPLKGVKEAYYNHFFNSFVIDTDDESEIKRLFESGKIKYYINRNLQDIKKESPYIPLTVFILLILQLIFKLPILINFAGLLLFYNTFNNGLLGIRLKVYNDDTYFSIVMFLLLLFITIPLANIISLSLLFIYSLKKYLINTLKIKLINKTLNTANQTVIVKREFEQLEVDAKDIRPNDIVCANKNTVLPVDGIIISGFTQIDQSMYTSEIPIVEKDILNDVTAGSINLTNYIEYRATGTINTSTLDLRNKHLLESVLTVRSDEILNNNLIIIMAVISLVICFIILIIYRNPMTILYAVLSLLVAIEPDVFNYIKPLNFLKNNHNLFKNGIIFNNTALLKDVYRVNTYVFDKESILTEELPEVKDVYISEEVKHSEFYQIAYMLVKKSSSPIATSIKHYLKNINLNTLDIDSIKNLTKKRSGFYDNHKFGEINDFKNSKVDFSKVQESINDFTNKGKKSLLFIEDNKIVGIITVQDIIKKETVEVIKNLKALNKKIIILDNNPKEITSHYANKLSADDAYSYSNNKDKLKILNNIKDEFIYISKNKVNGDYKQIIINNNLDYELTSKMILINKTSINDLIKLNGEYTRQEELNEKEINQSKIILLISLVFNNPIITKSILSLMPIIKLFKRAN